MTIVLLVILGLLIGAAINALADSLPQQGRPAFPHCHRCGAPRPVVGWVAWLGLVSGRWTCRYCRQPSQWRSLLVEALTAALAVWLYLTNAGPAGFAVSLLVTSILVLISVIDIEHRLILHVVSLPSIGLMLLISLVHPSLDFWKAVFGGLAGFAIVMGLFLLGEVYSRWQARRRGRPLDEVAFGFGDVTLATLLGVIVGWPGVVLALLIGILAAGLFGLAYLLWMLLRRRYTPHLPIPYGPFLILGAGLVYLGGRELFSRLIIG
ncbi:MAG TPA: A24 family peptidase [Anaerolineales bacterium]